VRSYQWVAGNAFDRDERIGDKPKILLVVRFQFDASNGRISIGSQHGAPEFARRM
jgi:hypothetical protein